jgi:hypothetical protein
MLFCMQHIAHTHYIHSDIKGTSFAISPSRYISWTSVERLLSNYHGNLSRVTLSSSEIHPPLRSKARQYIVGWWLGAEDFWFRSLKVFSWKSKPSYYCKYRWNIVSLLSLLQVQAFFSAYDLYKHRVTLLINKSHEYIYAGGICHRNFVTEKSHTCLIVLV